MTNKFHVEVVGGKYDGFTYEADYLSDIEDFIDEHWDNDSDYWVKAPNGVCMEIRDIYM